jgi:hypothetical protein
VNWSKLTSSGFLLSIGSVVVAWASYLAGALPAEYAVYITAGAGIIYALSRGLAKFNTELKSGFKTREFWLAVASVAVTVLVAIPGVVSPELAAAMGGSVLAAYGVSRGLAKEPEAQVEMTGSGEDGFLEDIV